VNYHFEKSGSALFKELKLSRSAAPLNIIRLTVPQRDHITVWLTRYGAADTMKELLDAELQAGVHMLVWDGTNSVGKKVISGFYEYHIKMSTGVISKHMLLFNDYSYFTSTNELEFVAKTDNDGNYVLDQAVFDFNLDVSFDWTDEQGVQLGTFRLNRYVDVWALHDDYEVSKVDSVFIHPEKGAEVNFTMIPK